jgi:prepilin-type N-terminal cleavage/methylation domain-containing protein
MKGFSLIEILVVLSIISIIGSISVVTYNTMRQVGNAKHATYVLVDSLKEAKNKAKMMEYDSDWGVNITNTDVIVFSGSSYSGRDVSKDRTYDIPDNLMVDGPTEFIFTKLTGLPSSLGTTTFSNDFGTSSSYILSGGAIGY